MREIKVRARNAGIPIGWIYGYFVIKDGLCFIINDEGEFKVIAGTECQYTGLKDKNRKEIYEGDVVDYLNKVWSVKWSGILARYTLVENKGIDMQFDAFYNDKVTEQIEVIGNIYENPEGIKE